jgi:hypothetical protein
MLSHQATSWLEAYICTQAPPPFVGLHPTPTTQPLAMPMPTGLGGVPAPPHAGDKAPPVAASGCARARWPHLVFTHTGDPALQWRN